MVINHGNRKLTEAQLYTLRTALWPDADGRISTYSVNCRTLEILAALGLIARETAGNVAKAEANMLTESQLACTLLNQDVNQWGAALDALKRGAGRLTSAKTMVWRITDAGRAAIAEVQA